MSATRLLNVLMRLARMTVSANQGMKEMAKTCVQVGTLNSMISKLFKKNLACIKLN